MAHIICLIHVSDNRATFTWSQGPADFRPYHLSLFAFEDLKKIADEARKRLQEVVWDFHKCQENLPTSCLRLAECGCELYSTFFDADSDGQDTARKAKKWLETQRDTKTVDSLEIIVDSSSSKRWAVPWNVVYDAKPDKEAFLSGDESSEIWKPFWGLRYNLAGGRRVKPMQRLPFFKQPTLVMVIDRLIRKGLPEEEQQRLAEFIEAHGKVHVVETRDELAMAIADRRPDILYCLCHATQSALVLGREEVSPSDLNRMLRNAEISERFQSGGLAFLNACNTVKPGEVCSYMDAFFGRGFGGVIGTEEQTIDRFANRFGIEFLEAFLDNGEPVGEILQRLRRRVPLGLLYGTYCPPDLRIIPEEDDEISPDTGWKVSWTRGVGGISLSGTGTVKRSELALPDEPYRSLSFYERSHRPLFAGRDDDVLLFAKLMDDPQARVILLHGESGVGKSSFLRAGVIPYLEEECVGYRFVREHTGGSGTHQEPADSLQIVRATKELFFPVANTLWSLFRHPYCFSSPTGATTEIDVAGILRQVIDRADSIEALAAALRDDVSLLGQILEAVGERLPFTPVLVIDQCEELFTLAETEEDRAASRQSLDALRRLIDADGDFRVILSLRTEYYGRLIDHLRRGLREGGQTREYLLTDFDHADLVEAIKRPTSTDHVPYTSEIPYQKYCFSYDQGTGDEDGVAEQIAIKVRRYRAGSRDSILPLAQVICSQLHNRVLDRDNRVITLEDLEAIGGVGGGMQRHVNALVDQLTAGHPRDEKAVKRLMTKLYLTQPDGSLTTALLPEDEVRYMWNGTMPFAELISGAERLRLLRLSSFRSEGREQRLVSLGHDSLARTINKWKEELDRRAWIVKTVSAVAVAAAVAILMTALGIAALYWNHQAQQQVALTSTVLSRFVEINAVFLRRVGAVAAAEDKGDAHNALEDLKAATNSYVTFLRGKNLDRVGEVAPVLEVIKKLETKIGNWTDEDKENIQLECLGIVTRLRTNLPKGEVFSDLERETIILDLGRRAVAVTKAIAETEDEKVRRAHRWEFESLYWAELYWAELYEMEHGDYKGESKLESLMVSFRRALNDWKPGPKPDLRVLKNLANEIKLAVEKLIGH